MYGTKIPVLFIVVASWPALSRLPVQVQKATFASTYLHSTCELYLIIHLSIYPPEGVGAGAVRQD